jgi:hypothetical protein
MKPLYATGMKESWQARGSATNRGSAALAAEQRPDKDSLIRRLALAKLRELRRAGLSYREIGVQFGLGRAGGDAEADGFAFRLPPERLLTSAPSGNGDAAMFLCALDAVDQGLAFFDCSGTLLHANRAVSRALEGSPAGERLREEIQQFAGSLCRVVQLRHLNDEAVVVQLSGTTANPCGGEGTISYSGSIAITGSVSAKSKTVTVAGSIDAGKLLIQMGDAYYKADPTTASFSETFARSTTTYTAPVTLTFASETGPSYTVTATLTITVSGNGQITGVALASLTCESAL